VVKDMLMESPFSKVKPTIFFLEYGWARVVTLRVRPEVSARQAMAAVEPVFHRFDPPGIYDFAFVDDQYAAKFREEKKIGQMSVCFTVLAILISCLGLIGLSLFVAHQRIKEISVRKVLGASVVDVWMLLSKDFLGLTLISCVIAIPLTWVLMNRWLEQYAYKTNLSWSVFVIASCSALLVTILTVSFQTIRAALINPAKNLKSE
jgi:putative ABC transport system permease protein